MRRTWRQVVLLVAGLLGTLAISLVGGVAGFRLAVAGGIGHFVNNFVMAPVALLMAVVVGIGGAFLGLVLAAALFLALGVGRHLMGPRHEAPAVEADALHGDQPGLLGLPWRSTGR